MAASREVIVYTAPGCPDCRAVKEWLQARGQGYEERDVSDPRVMQEARRRYGVRIAPITVIGETFLYGTFERQRPELERLLASGE